MRSILSLGLAAIAATTSVASAETTVVVLEFGPGGSVHRASSSAAELSAAAVASFWNALHRPSKRGSGQQHAGMPVVPDLFARADAGIVIGLEGKSVESMPTVASLGAVEDSDNVVGHIRVAGSANLMERASSKEVEVIVKEDMAQRLQSMAEAAVYGDMEGIEALSLAVDNDDAAAVADEQLGRMLKTLEKQADANRKTVVVHLVMDSTRRRLEEDKNEDKNEDRNEGEERDGENQYNNAYAYNYRTMYEIQSFNLYLWTSVGLVVILSMVIGAFINMPLMPDTLLYGETKMAD